MNRDTTLIFLPVPPRYHSRFAPRSPSIAVTIAPTLSHEEDVAAHLYGVRAAKAEESPAARRRRRLSHGEGRGACAASLIGDMNGARRSEED